MKQVYDSHKHVWGICSAADYVRSQVSGVANWENYGLMVLQAFLDDSKEQLGRPTLVIAGYIAPAESWVNFSREWADHLKWANLTEFKMSQMPQSTPEIIGSFYRIIENHIPASIDCVIDESMLHGAIEKVDWPSNLLSLKLRAKNPWYIATKALMQALFEHSEKIGLDEPIDLIYDEQQAEKAFLIESWDYFKYGMKEDAQKRIGSTPSFKCSKKFIPIQAADLVAWHLRKKELDGDSLTSNSIFPWELKKDIQRMAIRFTEDRLVKHLKWMVSPESQKQNLEFSYPVTDPSAILEGGFY